MQKDIHVSQAYADIMLADGRHVKTKQLKNNNVNVTVCDIDDTDIVDVSMEAIEHGAHIIKQVATNNTINIVATFYK